MTPPDAFELEVARIALAAAHDHGFALGGGHALIAHGIVDRPTEDIDLFTDTAGGVQPAAGKVARRLADAGLHVEQVAETDDLAGIFEGFERDMVEFVVTRDHHAIRLTLARLGRDRQPVVMDVGPVLHIDDVIGSKVAALVTRAEARDLIDVAAAQRRYTRHDLVRLGRQHDPALTGEDFADAMDRLDRLDDVVFRELYDLSPQAVAELRARFADWPRDPAAYDQ